MDTVVNKLEQLGIKYIDEGSGKGRMITVWLADIEAARPTDERHIGIRPISKEAEDLIA